MAFRSGNSGNHGQFRRPPKEVALRRALQSWGIRRGKNDDHDEFWDSVMYHVRDVENGEVEEQPADFPTRLPEDAREAISKVILQEYSALPSPSRRGSGRGYRPSRRDVRHRLDPFWSSFLL
jgi:hypothetical protein